MEAPRTTVVHLKRKGGAEVISCDIYVGRPMYQGGWRLPGSKWANPYRVGRDGDRAAVLRAYEAHVRASPALMAALPELRGKRLGCWCVGPRCLTCGQERPTGGNNICGHLDCHGDVLVGLLAERDAAELGLPK
jgi:hypothetical protein